MSEIPSSLSRDPDGLSLHDEYTSHLEPSGVRSDEQYYGNINDMDDCRDAPPPPPPPTTLPPSKKKNHRRNVRYNYNSSSLTIDSTSGGTTHKPTYSLKESVKAAGIRHADAEESITGDNESCSYSNDIVSPKQQQQQPLKRHSSSDERKPPSSPSSSSSSSSSSPKTRNIVEERLQLALSTYESDVLVLDEDPIINDYRDIPASPTVGDKGSSIQQEEVPIKKNSHRRRGLAIEKKNKNRHNKRGFLKKLFGGGKFSYRDDHGFPIPSSSEEQNRTENSFPQPCSEIEGNNVATITEDTIINDKKSFIENDSLCKKKPEPSPISTSSIIQKTTNDDVSQVTDKITQPAALVASNTLSLNTTEDNFDDYVSLQQHSTSSRGSTTKAQLLFSHDPPDDDHGDPPEHSGRPLLSPTACRGNNNKYFEEDTESTKENEQTRVETVRSRIAEVYEERIYHIHGDDQQQMKSITISTTDDVGDGITVRKLSPKPKIQEDYNSNNQSKDDDGPVATTSKSVSHSKPHLHVQIIEEKQCMDPVGASPIVQGKDIRGFGSGGTQMTRIVTEDPMGATPKARENTTVVISSNDPVGASPFHASKTATKILFEPELSSSMIINNDDDTIGFHTDDITDPPLDHDHLLDETMDNENDSGGASSPPINMLKKETVLPSVLSTHSRESPIENDNVAAINFVPVTRSNETQILQDLQTQSADDSVKNTILISTVSKPTGPRKICMNVDTSNTSEDTSKQTSPSSLIVKKDGYSASEKDSQLEIEKLGFKSASNTPSAAEKPLTVSAAAFTNAKAMVYLHQLHGEPSPRHSWHTSRKGNKELPQPVSEKSAVLAKLKKFNSKRMKNKKNVAKIKGPSPDEYSATNSRVEEEIMKRCDKNTDEEDLPTPKHFHSNRKKDLNPPSKNYVHHDPRKNFAPYSRFQGRRPRKSKSVPKPESPTPTDTSTMHLRVQGKNISELERYTSLALAIIPSGKISEQAVVRAIKLKHQQQVTGIPTRRALRVSLSPRPEGGNRFNFFPANESEIKDPIQRAGRRLLSKASIPIQTGARQFLSKREAIDRMWALIQLQSYIRRWRCEASFKAHKHSAVLMQKTFRGYKSRQEMKNMHSSATMMQKIVRGYLAAIRAYDIIYYVSRAQALARGFILRTSNARREKALYVIQAFCISSFQRKNYASTIIQHSYRAHVSKQNDAATMIQTAYHQYSTFKLCSTVIQSAWRSFSTRVGYKMFIVDVVTVQSIVRRRAACRIMGLIRKSIYSIAITRFQALWRGYSGRKRHQKSLAATKIQASWRRFQAYTDFIFVIVDILVVQRMVRQWLAIRETNELRKDRAAIILQSVWRRKQAQTNLLYSLVHIIMVQSVARRYLSKKKTQGRRNEVNKSLVFQSRKDEAATTIQKSWRCFWGFSHFLIVQYDITRIQALIRGKLAKDAYNLKLGCAILIQAVARRFIARKAVTVKVVSITVVASKIFELRERNAAKHIQFWWRIVLDWMKEKKAALVIERFFLHVKAEVDHELRRREKKRVIKGKQRKKYEPESEDNLIENIWMNTNAVDKNGPTDTKGDFLSQSAPRSRQPSEKKLQAKDDSNKKILQKSDHHHGFDHQGFDESILDMEPPPEFLHLAPSADLSLVSNITTPFTTSSVLNRLSKGVESSNNKTNKNEKHRLSTEDYIKKYVDLQTAPNRLSESQSFFSEDGNNNNSVSSKLRRQSSEGTVPTDMQSHTISRNMIPRKKPMKLSISGFHTDQGSFDMSGKMPVTPRSSSGGSRSGSTPRAVVDMSGKMPVTPRSSSGGSRSGSTPRAVVDMSGKMPVTPRSSSGGSRSGSTPRAVSRSRRDNSSSQFLPPVTPTRNRSKTILRSGTADTAMLRSSPRKHPNIHGRGGNRVMIMKTQSNFIDDQSMKEAHEIMLLGDDYGEV